MSHNENCPQSICIISLLHRQEDGFEERMWSPLLTTGHEQCKQGKTAQALLSFEQALQLAEDLIPADPNSVQLKASSLICIGALSFCRKNFKSRATEYFDRGWDLCPPNENYGKAVSLFAAGFVYESYESQKEWREIFRFYSRSLKALSDLPIDPDVARLQSEIRRRLENAFKQWREETGGAADASADSSDGGPPSPDGPPNHSIGSAAAVKLQPTDGAPDSSAESLTMRPAPERGKVLEFLPIFGRIAAGTPVLAPDQAIGYVETDRILINGKPYYVSDGDSNTIRLPFSSEVSYVVLRVVGDSMDKAGIEEGDYVVLRVSARMALPLRPDDGDIVAVGLPPEGNEITLKRFRRRENKIAFEPESSNSMYEPHTFNTLGDFDMPIRISGILAAVLKPISE